VKYVARCRSALVRFPRSKRNVRHQRENQPIIIVIHPCAVSFPVREVKRYSEPHEGDGHNVSIPEGCDLPESLTTFDTWMKNRVAEIPQINAKREASKSA